MNELELARKEISRIDAEMAKLFEERMHQCESVAAYKKEHGLSVRDSAREAELIERSRTLIESKEIESYYVRFLRSTIDLSCKYQSKLLGGMKVAYCGDDYGVGGNDHDVYESDVRFITIDNYLDFGKRMAENRML